MKHLESIVFAAFIGGLFGITTNYFMDFSEDNVKALEAGAIIGAVVQLTMRLTGVS